MPDAQNGLIDSLRRNRFCIGVKRGSEYRCGGDADENAIDEAVKLLIEAIERIQHWRVWETWWIEEAMGEWLNARDRLEVQLRGKYSEEVVNDLLGLIDKFIGYNEQFLNHWHDVGDEVRRLIDNLMSDRAEIVIRGDGASGISMHGEYVTLEVDKTRNGITVKLVLKELDGANIEVPDVFRRTMSGEEYEKFINEVLKALEGGFEETDGFIEEGKAAMNTTQVWQVIAWTLLYPSEVHIHIDTININDGDVAIRWHLRSNHESLKGKILNAEKLGENGLLAFMFTAILGDGYVKIVKDGRGYDAAVIKITMSGEKFDRWEPLLNRLWNKFRWHKYPNDPNADVIYVTFLSGYAIDLARAMIGVLPPILRDVLDALSFEKWSNLRRIAKMEVKYRRGEMQVDVAGYKFTVDVKERAVMLELKVKDDEAGRVIEVLRAVYGDGLYAYVNKSGRYLLVRIPMYAFEKYDEIKAQVIEVLCKKLERIKDERKRQEIIKQLMRLMAPTEGAAAA